MKRTDIWICLGLALLAFILATIGSGMSIPRSAPTALAPAYLPESWEPDEDNGLDDSLRFLHNLSLRPTDFIEAAFPKEYVAAVYALVFRCTGISLDTAYSNHPEWFISAAYRAGFAVSALFFAGAVVLIFLSARLSFSRVSSFYAALGLALNVLALTQAHFAVYDVHLLFFETLLLYLILKGAAAPWLSVAIGLMASTKYTGLLFFPMVPITLFFRTGRFLRIGVVAGCLLIAGAVFLVLNPYAIIEFPQFLHDLGVIYFTRSFFKGFHGGQLAFMTHLDNLVAGGLFIAILTLAAVLAALLTKNRSRIEQVGLAVLFLYYLLSGWSRFNAMRFTLPLTAPLALLVAPFVERLMSLRRKWVPILLSAGFVWAFAVCCEADLLFYRDSRVMARRFIEEHRCTSVATFCRPAYVQPALPERMAVWLNLSQTQPRQTPLYYRLQSFYRRILGRAPAPSTNQGPDINHYELNRTVLASSAPECIVISSFDIGRYFAEPNAFPETTRFLRELITGRLGYRVAARFQTRTYLVSRIEFINPEIIVLERVSPAK